MDYDVVVIGASSAGLYLADRLARAGKKVGVFEQNPSNRPSRRTLIVTPALKPLLADLLPSIVVHQIHTMAVDTGNTHICIPLSEPDLVIERSALISSLANRAVAAGAELYYGYRFQNFEKTPQGVRLSLRTDSSVTVNVTARAVIGADGIQSEVARAAGLAHAPTVPLLQAEIALPPQWDPSLTQVWFEPNDTRFFYWLIPQSNDHGVVGLVGDEHSQTRLLLQRFMERHGLKPLEYQGGKAAMHRPRLRAWTRVGDGLVLLVGDAAGQVKVTSVGGTVSGLLGASAAARALLTGTNYDHELRSVRNELNVHWLIRVVLDRMDQRAYQRLGNLVTPAVKQYLSWHNRDEIAPSFWQLLIRQPRLLTLALSEFVRSANEPPHYDRQTVTSAE